MKIKIFASLLAVSLFVVACEEDYEEETLPNYEMSGQWYVQTYVGGTASTNVVLGYTPIVTANTAAADGSQIIIDDNPDGQFPNGQWIWPFRCKANVSGNLTFSIDSTENLYSLKYDTIQNYVTIMNGKISPNQGKSLSGKTVDSIYMEATFSEDTTGTVYIFAGHYRTGFQEDIP